MSTTGSFDSSICALARLPAAIARRILAKGLGDTLRRGSFLAYEQYREWQLGIDTAGFIDWNQLGDDPASVDYEPVGYRTLDRALRQVPVRPGVDVFLDYGCGKGRPVIHAATLPFARVIGVEMSERLCREARANVQRAGARLRCPRVEIVQADAARWEVPDAVSVVFMFNPFTGHLLEAARDRLEQSYRRRPRPLTLLYVLPLHGHDLFRACDWLRLRKTTPSQGLLLNVYESG